MVANGKLVYDFDLEGLAAAHTLGGAEATLLLRPLPERAPWTPVEVDALGGVYRLADFDTRESAPPGLTPCVFTGVHIVETALVDRLPDGPSCIVRQGYVPALRRRGSAVRGWVSEAGYWAEPSTASRYLDLVLDVLDGWALPERVGGEVVVEASARVDPSARLEAPCYVGRGAVVAPGAHLHRVSVEAEAEARGTLRDAVVLPGFPPLSQDTA